MDLESSLENGFIEEPVNATTEYVLYLDQREPLRTTNRNHYSAKFPLSHAYHDTLEFERYQQIKAWILKTSLLHLWLLNPNTSLLNHARLNVPVFLFVFRFVIFGVGGEYTLTVQPWLVLNSQKL